MGCRGSRSTVKAVNGEAHAQKFASSTLPQEVIAGLDKVLRNGALASNLQTTRKWSPVRVPERQNTDDTQQAFSKAQSFALHKPEPPKPPIPEVDPEPAEVYVGKPGELEELQGDIPNLLNEQPVSNPYMALLHKRSADNSL